MLHKKLIRMNQEGCYVEDSHTNGQDINLITELYDEEHRSLLERRQEKLDQEQKTGQEIMVDGRWDAKALSIRKAF